MSNFSNQYIVMPWLRDNLSLDDYMCAAITGCMIAESGINPQAYNKGEKNGTLKSSGACNKGTAYGTKTCPWSYGAGIVQWTYTDRKEKALIGGLGMTRESAISLIKTKGIESLSLEDQLKMVAYEISKGMFKNNFNVVLRKCETLKDAVAATYCRYLGGFSSKTNVPTDADIKRLDKGYNRANMNSNSGFALRYKYAVQALENYHKTIDL